MVIAWLHVCAQLCSLARLWRETWPKATMSAMLTKQVPWRCALEHRVRLYGIVSGILLRSSSALCQPRCKRPSNSSSKDWQWQARSSGPDTADNICGVSPQIVVAEGHWCDIWPRRLKHFPCAFVTQRNRTLTT